MRISDWSSDVCSSDLRSQHFRSLSFRLRLKHDIVRQRKAGSAIFPHWGFCRCFHDYLFIHHAAVPLYRNALSPSRQMTGVRNSPLTLKSHVGAADTDSAAPPRPSAPPLPPWSFPPAELGSASCRHSYCQYESHTADAVVKNKPQ